MIDEKKKKLNGIAFDFLRDYLKRPGAMDCSVCEKLQKLFNVDTECIYFPSYQVCKNYCDELLKRVDELLGERNE